MQTNLKQITPIILFLLFIAAGITLNAGPQDKAPGKAKNNAQDKIVEKVAVEYWAVPIFAVAEDGKAILDLKESDIRLKVNNKIITNFTLVKREFSRQSKKAAPGEKKPDLGTQKKLEKKFQRKRNVFLLFDSALSSQGCTEASQFLAQKIVKNADKDTRFFVMSIEPFAGLVYAGGGTSDKKEIIRIIQQKIKGRKNLRVPNFQEVVAVMGTGRSKYEAEDLPFLQNSASKYYHRKSKSFFDAFESLYYVLNSVDDNKFIYLFTEGVSDAVISADKGGRSMYDKYMVKVARYLGRSGAVLFIINPLSSAGAQLSEASGTSSLKFLAQRSGGKYLEGSDRKLSEKIENMHMAYYEVFFPADANRDTLKITVNSKRTGLVLHTLSETEKARTYGKMNKIEKEFLALNLVSGNPMYQKRFNAKQAVVAAKDVSSNGKKIVFSVDLPGGMKGKNTDLYKIWISKTKKGKETRVEKERQFISPSVEKGFKVTFKNTKPGDETYFVFINPRDNSAVVHGLKKISPDQTFAVDIAPEESEEWATHELMTDLEKIKKKNAATGKKDKKTLELERLLNGAASYCKKLKSAAFHYICKEKIVETRKPLTRRRNIGTDVANTPQHPMFTRSVIPELEMTKTLKFTKEQIDKRVYNYRLINVGSRVKEERYKDKEAEQDAKKSKQKFTGRLRFLSAKAVFGPITILDAARQGKYNFRLLGKKKLKGRSVAVIEAFPRSKTDTMFIYGKIWIDTEDFSVLKIKANPNSILGYDKLEKLADALQSKLKISLETEFFKFRSGIRFPTAVHFEENYKGGPIITKQRGSRSWNRTFTLTTYEEYMFFDVNTEVSYEQQ